MIINRITTAGVLIAVATVAGAPAEAQQRPHPRPMSINEWLQAERNNANMQRAVEEYERARYGTATPQQAYRPQAAYQPPSYGQPPQPAYRTYAPEQAQAPTGAPQAAPAQPVAPQPLTSNEPPGYQQPQYPQQQYRQPQYSQQQYQQPQPYPYQAQAGGQIPQQPNQPDTYQVPPNAVSKIERDMQEITPTSSTDRGYYVAGHLGWSTAADAKFESATSSVEPATSLFAFQAEGAMGYKFANGISFELAGNYNYAEFDDTDGYASVFAVMPNAKVEFDIGQPVHPYVTGGVGFGILNAEDPSATVTGSDSGLALAYQLGFGAMYPINLQTSLDFGYRYFGTSEADLDLNGTAYTADYGSHTLMLGLRHQL